MSQKTMVAFILLIIFSSSAHGGSALDSGSVIKAKEIASVFVDYTHRHLNVVTFKSSYFVAFEKPCKTLRRSGVALKDDTNDVLTAGTELQVGVNTCKIKSVRRDLGLRRTNLFHEYPFRTSYKIDRYVMDRQYLVHQRVL